MPPTAARQPVRPARRIPRSPLAQVLWGVVGGALPGLVLLAGRFGAMGDMLSSVLLPVSLVIALLAVPVTAWNASRRGRLGAGLWVAAGVWLGLVFSLVVWLGLIAMAAGSFSFMPGELGAV